jgi:predicted SAM-dependent methyltransferase/glycosyltransferase involved in cell wall biosynthesis
MRLALIFGPYSVSSKPLNFFVENIWISNRGLTGSDLAVVMTAKILAKMGHDVSLFTFHVPGTMPQVWEDVKMYCYEDRIKVVDDSFDTLISWNEPDVFRGMPTNNVRVCQQMLNDFHYCVPGFEELIDIWTAPSEMHKQWMLKLLPTDKYVALPLGSDPSWFPDQTKVKGSVVWISSPDRGLHLLLQQWPEIKKAVPDAHLKVFYHINDGLGGELGNRINYVKYALSKLKDLGVEHVGSVSRNQITAELAKTAVMVAPLSTISPTEGFSVSTIEACTAGCLPVVGDIDCLGSIYGKVAAMVPAPVEKHLDNLTYTIVRGLTNETWRKEVADKCKEFAQDYTWDKNVQKLVSLIIDHPKFRKNKEVPNISLEAVKVPELEKYNPFESKTPETISSEKMVKLNIGAGPNMFPFPGWTNYDREDFKYLIDHLQNTKIEDITPHYGYRKLAAYIKSGGKTDVKVHDLRKGFEQHADNSVDLIYIGQVIEHLNPIFESPKLLKDCYRMLKTGGVLRMTTPDLDILVDAYKNGQMDKFNSEQPTFYTDADPSSKLSYIMFGACGEKCTWNYYEGHFFLYARSSMTKFLKDAGFKEIIFYDEAGKSLSLTMLKEVIDEGLTHSILVEARK